MDGIILVDKKQTWTSQDVCSKVKHILHVKKVGHCGTLDPFATGLLIVLVKNGTKLGQFIELFDKTYIARLKLGVKTSSGDIDGEEIERKDIPNLNKEDIIKVLRSFIGKQSQLPPMYSALKVNGKALYKYAREGKEIERKPRDIEVYDIQFIDYSEDTITFMAHVSKGTYIRTLGEDIAEKLGTVGHLTDLRRTKVGKYLVNDACDVEEVSEERIIGFKDCLNFMEHVRVDIKGEQDVKNGKQIFINTKNDTVAIFNIKDELLAIYERANGNMFKSVRGFF